MKDLLKNNSNEMKTIVETFVIEETASLIYDNEQLDDWNRLVEELGLVGQTSIQVKEKSPIPFMHLKKNLVNVFGCLCPVKTDVEKYNVTPIPLEILSLVSLSKREGYFDKIQIWYDDKNPDPVCLGLRYADEAARQSGYYWNMETYILGKWADVKHSFADLTKMATKRFIQQETIKAKENIKTAQRALEDVEIKAFNEFGSDVNGSDNDQLPF